MWYIWEWASWKSWHSGRSKSNVHCLCWPCACLVQRTLREPERELGRHLQIHTRWPPLDGKSRKYTMFSIYWFAINWSYSKTKSWNKISLPGVLYKVILGPAKSSTAVSSQLKSQPRFGTSHFCYLNKYINSSYPLNFCRNYMQTSENYP